MDNYVKQLGSWMRRHFRRPDEVDPELRRLKQKINEIAARTAAVSRLETTTPQDLRRLIDEKDAAIDALNKHIAMMARRPG